LLALNGDDLRNEPLEKRKGKLERLLSRAHHRSSSTNTSRTDGELVFRHACKLRLEGIVSKRIDMPYRSGRTKSWIKVNPKNPAMLRIQDGTWW
jgi:bifunctional non-homologous end joining protein LigD